MAIPDFQTIMRPLLEFAADGNLHSIREAREWLAERFKLTDEERKTLLPSGRQRVFDNRVAWAKVYLHHAGLVDTPREASSEYQIEDARPLKTRPKGLRSATCRNIPNLLSFAQHQESQRQHQLKQQQ